MTSKRFEQRHDNTAEAVERDFRYLIADELLDRMLVGELTADEAAEQFKAELAQEAPQDV